MQLRTARLLVTAAFAASLTGVAAAEVSPLESPTAESASAATVIVQSGSVQPASSETIVVQPGQVITVQPGQVVVLFVQPPPTATNAASSPDAGDPRADGDEARSTYSPYAEWSPFRHFRDEQRFPSER